MQDFQLALDLNCNLKEDLNNLISLIGFQMRKI